MDNEKQIRSLNTQIAFTSALLFSVSITIYATMGYKDLLVNPKTSRFNKKYLYNLGALAASISLIVTIYFFIISYERYETDSTQENYDYYMASTLSLLAQSIRTNTIFKYPYVENLESEDII